MSNLFISKGLNSQILSLHLHAFPHGAETYVFKNLTFLRNGRVFTSRQEARDFRKVREV